MDVGGGRKPVVIFTREVGLMHSFVHLLGSCRVKVPERRPLVKQKVFTPATMSNDY